MNTTNIIDTINPLHLNTPDHKRYKLELIAILFAGLVLLYKWLEQLYLLPHVQAYQSVFFWSTISFFLLLLSGTQSPDKHYTVKITALLLCFLTHIAATIMGFSYVLDLHNLQSDSLISITRWNTLNYLIAFVIFKKLYRALIAAIIIYLIPLAMWLFFIYTYSYQRLGLTSLDLSTHILTGAIDIFICCALMGIIYITNKEQFLTQLAVTDSLTGIANRLYLDKALQSMFMLSTNGISSVALCDIDKFKIINDTYSHAVGDKVLQHFANILRNNLHSSNIVGRYGGEEFLIIFPNTPKNQAVCICEVLRTTIEQYDWSAVAPELSITASFGVSDNSGIANDAHSSDIMVDRADAKMYEAKNTGRNRVCY